MRATTLLFNIFSLLLISLAIAQPTKPLLQDRSKSAPAKSTVAPAAPGAPAGAVTCRCTIVFGDKNSLTVNTAQGSTNGLSGETNNNKACTAQLLVGSGCTAAISTESRDNCVKSQACITA